MMNAELKSPRPAWLRWLPPVVAIAVLYLVFLRLRHVLAGHSVADVLQHLERMPHQVVLLGLMFTACSYAALAGYDLMALRYIGAKVRTSRALLTSFTAFSLSHNIGLATLSAFAIRLRMYGALHIPARRIAMMSGFCAFTTALGSTTLLAYALLTQSNEAQQLTHLPLWVVKLGGVIALMLVMSYCVLTVIWRRPVRFWKINLSLPTPATTGWQLLAAGLDLCFAAAALYQLLPAPPVSYHAFLALYVMSMLAVTVSNVPGGLGVLESVIILALPDIPVDQLLASLIVFRVIYYLCPLCIAAAIFLWHEWRCAGETGIHDKQADDHQAAALPTTHASGDSLHDRSADHRR